MGEFGTQMVPVKNHASKCSSSKRKDCWISISVNEYAMLSDDWHDYMTKSNCCVGNANYWISVCLACLDL